MVRSAQPPPAPKSRGGTSFHLQWTPHAGSLWAGCQILPPPISLPPPPPQPHPRACHAPHLGRYQPLSSMRAMVSVSLGALSALPWKGAAPSISSPCTAASSQQGQPACPVAVQARVAADMACRACHILMCMHVCMRPCCCCRSRHLEQPRLPVHVRRSRAASILQGCAGSCRAAEHASHFRHHARAGDQGSGAVRALLGHARVTAGEQGQQGGREHLRAHAVGWCSLSRRCSTLCRLPRCSCAGVPRKRAPGVCVH